MKLLFLFLIILIIQINGYSAKKSFKATKSISHSKDSSEYSKVSKDHSKPKTTKSTTTVATTSTTVHTTVDPFKNPVLFNSTVKESIRTELASAIPNLNQTKFDEFFSALNVIYTLFLQLPYNSSAQICNIIYNAYISGDSTLNSAVLTNITNLISAKLCINKKQTNLIIAAFQQVYGVALSLPVSVIINISAITSSASGINLPPPPPSPFQNLSTFNPSVNDMIKAELANISTLTASQQEYFISQVNVIYTVTSQLPISTSSAISNSFFSAFVTGSSSIDPTTLSNIKSQLSTALPNLTSIQLNSVANAFNYLYESFSTSTISGIINILAIIGSASGISIPPPTLTPPIPFDNMTTFDSSSVSNIKQELVSAIPNLTPEQLDFIINEANIMYSVASRMNNDSREAIIDILFNAFINGDTYLDASTMLEVNNELSTALPDLTTDQKNIILFALRLLFEFKSILPFNTLVDIYGIVSSGSGIYVQIPQPPFENLSSLDSSTLTKVIDNVKAAFPNYTQSQLDSVTTALTIINTVHRQLPLSSISTIAEIMYNASITQTSALDSILTRISNELEAALPTLNQTQKARVLNAGKNLFAVAQAMPFDKFVNIGLILTNYSDIVATLPPPPFEIMVTLSNAVIINIVDLVRTKIPSMVQFHIDVAISQMNILYNLVSQLPTNTLSNIYDIFFNAYISSDSYLDSTAMSAISTDISSSLPTLTSSQLNSIMLACNYLFVVAQTVPLDVILDIGNIINGPAPNNQYPNLVTMDSAISSKVAENLIIGIPNITQSQIDTTIFDINVLFTVYTQLPASAISNLNDLAYNVSISASSSFDSSAILNLTKTIHGAIPNITAFEMSTLLNSLFNLTEIATILPFNIFVNVSGILTSSSGFALPLPTAPFDNMRTFSASTVTSVKGEIMAGLSSISNSQLDYIIFQMNIVYTVASQLPINVLSTINSVIYGEYIYLSPYLGSDPTSNIANETLTALPSIDPRQLKSFIDAIKFLFVSATPLPFSAILNIYTYVGAEANISLPMPLPPPVFKNMVNFDQPVEDAIMNALITEIIKITSVNVTVAQFQPYMDAINVVYNVAQRVPLNLSVAIQQLMYDSYISEINYIDSTNTAYLIQELQSAIPNINNYQLNIIYGSFTMLLQMAYALSVNAVLNIYSIASNGSIVSLPSPTPFSIIPIPDNQAVDNISAIIMTEHPDGDLLKINKIIYAMDIIYTVTNMLPLNVVFNISGIAYNAYPINSPPTTALLSDALQNITEFDAGTQTQIRNVLTSALPSFTESQVNQTMSAINLLHSVALSLTSNAINNIISIAYSIIGFY